MRDPRYFTRALVVSQLGSTLLYLVVGVVVYYYCGTMVASPALGSAGTLIKKIAYGLSLPGLIATTTIVVHVHFSPLNTTGYTLTGTAPKQILLRPHSARLSTSNLQLPNPLDNLARLYIQLHGYSLCHRERDPRIQRPRLAGRCLARCVLGLPAYWMYVVL